MTQSYKITNGAGPEVWTEALTEWYEKARKSPKKQRVPMNGKSKDFCPNLLGGTLQKRRENHEKKKLCPCRGKCAHERGKVRGFWPKFPGSNPTKKAGKIMKRGICVHEGENVAMKVKSKGY